MRSKLIWGTAVSLSFILVLAACTSVASEPEVLEEAATVPPTPEEPEEIVVDLPDMGEAPEFRNDVWLNSDEPVSLADQRGKVVLLEFWTFG